MKPEQFIREYGVDKAREVVEGRSKTYMPELFRYWSEELNDYVLAPKYASFLVEDLKRLVESVDRVNQHGGYLAAKELLSFSIVHQEAFGKDAVNNETIKSLRDSIKDHESIYGGGDE